jgi:hypothetical protein
VPRRDLTGGVGMAGWTGHSRTSMVMSWQVCLGLGRGLRRGLHIYLNVPSFPQQTGRNLATGGQVHCPKSHGKELADLRCKPGALQSEGLASRRATSPWHPGLSFTMILTVTSPAAESSLGPHPSTSSRSSTPACLFCKPPS